MNSIGETLQKVDESILQSDSPHIKGRPANQVAILDKWLQKWCAVTIKTIK